MNALHQKPIELLNKTVQSTLMPQKLNDLCRLKRGYANDVIPALVFGEKPLLLE